MSQTITVKTLPRKPLFLVLGQLTGTLALFCLLTERIATFDGGSQALGRAILLLSVLLLVAFLLIVPRLFRTRKLETSDTEISLAIPISPVVKTALKIVCAIGFLWHFLALVGNCIHLRQLSDITTTTMAAIDSIRSGQNPYSIFIDGSPGYSGYKYLPWMAIIYFPLETLLRERGMLITNFILDIATASLVFCIAKQLTARWIFASLEAAWFSMALYLGSPLVVLEIYRVGVTDLSAVVPLLGAALWFERKSISSGICVGISIATKLLPGLLFFVVLAPVANSFRARLHNSKRYLLGIFCGVLPMMGYWLAAPTDFYHNIFEFVLLRGGGSVSWLPHSPLIWSQLFRDLTLGVLVGGSGYLFCKPVALIDRLGFGVVSILLVLLSSTNNHRNYQLWWIPMVAIILGVTAVNFILVSSTIVKSED
jgi:hypothetical protein